MKIVIDNQIFTADKHKIMVILSETDKKNIANMAPKATAYAEYDDVIPEQQIETWMKTMMARIKNQKQKVT